GGHAGGEVAAGLAVGRLRELAGRDDLGPEDVRVSLDSANAAILASAAVSGEPAGMATTVAGLGVVRVAGADHWAVFNVGDSRVYRLAHGRPSQGSIDHPAGGGGGAARPPRPAAGRPHPPQDGGPPA